MLIESIFFVSAKRQFKVKISWDIDGQVFIRNAIKPRMITHLRGLLKMAQREKVARTEVGKGVKTSAFSTGKRGVKDFAILLKVICFHPNFSVQKTKSTQF